MKYTFFEFENFKGISKLRLDVNSAPTGRIYTLVGLNECGKTTILEAIDYFAGGTDDLAPNKLSGRIRPDPHDLIPTSQRANFNGSIVVRAGFDIEDSDFQALKTHLREEHEYCLEDIEREVTLSETYDFVNSTYQEKNNQWSGVDGHGRRNKQRKRRELSSDQQVWQATARFLRKIIPPIWYFPHFLFDFPDMILLSGQENESVTNRFYRALIQDILDSLDGGLTIADHIVARYSSQKDSERRALESLMLDISRKVTNDVFTAWNQILNRQVSDKRVDINVGETADGTCFLKFQIVDADGNFYLHERSLGFRWFFVFLLLTFYRGARREGPRNLMFLFDEPASNLHSRAQALLLDSLEKLTDRCVIIYTTHSHHLINPMWLEQTFVVRNLGLEASDAETDYSARKTDIVLDRYRNFAAQHPDQSYYFQPILDKLDYAPSKLELVSDVVMVEGKQDYYALRYFNEVILPSAIDLHFMPGTGAGALDRLISLYLGWGRNFLIILDSDSEGTQQRTRYIKNFGMVLNERIFVLGDANPNFAGLAIEKSIGTADCLAIQSLSFPNHKYSKKKLHLSLQEALITKKSTQLQESTKENFRRVFEFLDQRLREWR